MGKSICAFVSLLISIVLLAVGCGGGGGNGESTESAARPTPTSDALISVGTPESIAPVLVNFEGRTLYAFSKDRTGVSACFGRCAKAWKPLVLHGEPETIRGARSDLIDSVRRPDGAVQATYANWPLYTLASEHTGEAHGAGLKAFGGTWRPIRPNGSLQGDPKAEVLRPPTALITTVSPANLGQVLGDSSHKTLYRLDADRRGGGTSACYGACALTWHPVQSGGTPVASTGVDKALLGAFARNDEATQVTYDGWPLYTYIYEGGEESEGNGKKAVGGSFSPVRPSGKPVG